MRTPSSTMSVCSPGYLNGACPLTSFQELNRILAPLPVGCSLLVHIPLFYFVFRLADAVSFRLFLTQPILEPCSTFLTTIAIMSTYHGNLRASIGQGPCIISTACVCIMCPLVVR